MTQIKKRKSPWLKRILLGGFILLLIGAGIYWYIATDKFADTKDRKPAYTVNAMDFIKEFSLNETAANTKYKDKIVAVRGTVSQVEPADTTVNIKFIDPNTQSYVIFAFQEQHLAEAKTLKAGDSVSIKGSFSSGIYSDIMEATSINFKRSTIEHVFKQ